MRTRDELHLVKIANALLDRFPGIGALLDDRDGSLKFFQKFDEADDLEGHFDDTVARMSNAKLGMIIGLRSRPQDYQNFAFLQTYPTAKRIVNTDDYPQGHDQLVLLAIPVLIAAIYDILHAERVKKEKDSLLHTNTAECAQTRNWPSYPKRPMTDFVVKHRMNTQNMRLSPTT